MESSVCQICCVSANGVVSSSAHTQTIVFSCFLFAAGVRRESTVSVANLFYVRLLGRLRIDGF